MNRGKVRYSEAFQRQVVEEIARGKFKSLRRAQRAYGIKGNETVGRWVRKFGREDLLPKRIRIETMTQRDEIKEARKRIRELEAALADAHIENSLERAHLKIACDRMGEDVGGFKKKLALTLSDLHSKKGRL